MSYQKRCPPRTNEIERRKRTRYRVSDVEEMAFELIQDRAADVLMYPCCSKNCNRNQRYQLLFKAYHDFVCLNVTQRREFLVSTLAAHKVSEEVYKANPGLALKFER